MREVIQSPVVIVLLFVAVLVFLLAIARGGIKHHPKGQAKREAAARLAGLNRNLLLKTLNDQGKVNSLIRLEQEKAPHLRLDEAMESAIARWEKDNR